MGLIFNILVKANIPVHLYTNCTEQLKMANVETHISPK